MMQNEENLSPGDNIKIDNQIKRLLLESQGGTFHQGTEEIPPEIEQQWLNNIIQFEEQYAKSKQIPVYEFLGKPAFRNADEIPDEEIEKEFDGLIQMMESRGISFNALTTYEDQNRLFYKFITEVLFNELTDDFILPGGFKCYTYEEFVPNHDYDIRYRANDLIDYLFKDERPLEKRFDEFYIDAKDFIETESDTSYKKKISPTITHFFEAMPVRILNHSEILKIDFELFEYPDPEKSFREIEGRGHAQVLIDYTATLESGNSVHFFGEGKMELERYFGWWKIVRAELPGLTIE